MPGLPFASLPNAWLLLALVVQVLSYPFLDYYQSGRIAIAGFDLVILALALRASRAGGHEAWLGYVLVVPAMALATADVVATDVHGVYAASLVAQALFHAFVVLCLLQLHVPHQCRIRRDYAAQRSCPLAGDDPANDRRALLRPGRRATGHAAGPTGRGRARS